MICISLSTDDGAFGDVWTLFIISGTSCIRSVSTFTENRRSVSWLPRLLQRSGEPVVAEQQCSPSELDSLRRRGAVRVLLPARVWLLYLPSQAPAPASRAHLKEVNSCLRPE